MAEPEEEVINQVEAGLEASFVEEHPQIYGTAMCILMQEPKHYRPLARLLSNQTAFKSYILQMLAPHKMQGLDRSLLSEDEPESILLECKDRFGTQVQSSGKTGILALSVQSALKRSSATFFKAGSAVSAAQPVTTAVVGSSIFANARVVGNAGVVLAVGYMGYEFYSFMRQYFKGEIDGYALIEELTSMVVTMAAAFAGSAGALALCAGAGPWGLGFAAVAGGVIAVGLSDAAIRSVFQGVLIGQAFFCLTFDIWLKWLSYVEHQVLL